MHVISRGPFKEAAEDFPNDATALDATYLVLKGEIFANPDELKAQFPSLDRMKYRNKWWVIDVGGNKLRIMFFADFERGKIFIKHIVTHAEYDKLVKKYRESKE
ncbi:type II toxin-antitoxin system HigB family toxin [Pantoea sp. LMR881]|uniref:type II toxin-antitoxin system HigB family toxin n=1 Tax=Pantoea sp. LMR881 TaxID=3014336 RepID=UPI0022B04C15|nr:type II toxin-antitoxin system HigB family toxin [Pantoea sp. LMR881]MCZ4061278.1 type II toxin-antitoxin system HigB family toxin [Pantoea sp. LMR881]